MLQYFYFLASLSSVITLPTSSLIDVRQHSQTAACNRSIDYNQTIKHRVQPPLKLGFHFTNLSQIISEKVLIPNFASMQLNGFHITFQGKDYITIMFKITQLFSKLLLINLYLNIIEDCIKGSNWIILELTSHFSLHMSKL